MKHGREYNEKRIINYFDQHKSKLQKDVAQ